MRIVSALLAALVVNLAGSAAERPLPKLPYGTSLEDAYVMFHQAGFRVAIRNHPGWHLSETPWNDPQVMRVLPGADMVTIVPMNPDAFASVVGIRHPARVHVPNLVGNPASAAIGWAAVRGVPWSIRTVPNLPPSRARQLYRAYRVVAQSPAPGSTITQNHWVTLRIEPR